MLARYLDTMREGCALWADYIACDLRGIAWSVAQVVTVKRLLACAALMALAYVGALGWAVL